MSGRAGIEMTPITIALQCFTGYKYSTHLALIAILHSFTFRLGFFSLLLLLTTMEDKRGTKRSRSPSKEGSSSLSSVSTPPPMPFGSLLPPVSPVVDLSSSEDLIPDTSRDEELIKRLFGDLNRDLLRPPDDGKVIIISDSNEKEEEVHEEDATNAEVVPCSDVKSSSPTASAADVDDAPEGVQDDSNDGHTPDRAQGGRSGGRDEAGSPYATTPRGRLQGVHAGGSEDGDDPALLHHQFFCKELLDGDAESLLALTPFMPLAVPSASVMSL
jgi:hypothetical protein